MLENESQLGEILKQLEKNTAVNQEVLKSVKFLRHYFIWQSFYNTIKIIFIVAIVVLGVISWRSIVENVFKIYG